VLVDIANREIPMENMAEGIWERSLGPGLRQRASTEGAVGDRRFASREDLCIETSKTPKPRQRFGPGHIIGGRMGHSIARRANPYMRSSENQ
jgi:hypothetical protein